jgi:RNase H-fold protein (predicted Holliday junction resolvase)
MFDIIAIDWGSKRFGLAFGSSYNGIVLACNYDCLTTEIWSTLSKEILDRRTQKIIIGMPTTFDFKKTEVSVSIETFVLELKERFELLEIIIVNERNSTKKALLKNPELKHHSLNHQAAVEILEGWLGEG